MPIKVNTKHFRQIQLSDSPVDYEMGSSVLCYYEFLPTTDGIKSYAYIHSMVELGQQESMYYYLLNGVIPVCLDEDNFWKLIDYENERT